MLDGEADEERTIADNDEPEAIGDMMRLSRLRSKTNLPRVLQKRDSDLAIQYLR
jgi:hypothetical protein